MALGIAGACGVVGGCYRRQEYLACGSAQDRVVARALAGRTRRAAVDRAVVLVAARSGVAASGKETRRRCQIVACVRDGKARRGARDRTRVERGPARG